MVEPGPWQLVADDPGHSPPAAIDQRVTRGGGGTEHYHIGI